MCLQLVALSDTFSDNNLQGDINRSFISSFVNSTKTDPIEEKKSQHIIKTVHAA